MTQQQLILRYGNPLLNKTARIKFEQKFMMVWKYPALIQEKIPQLGVSIYINKEFKPDYERFLLELIARNLHGEIKENDQCFEPRYQRGSTTEISKHTWAIATDLNASQNPIYNTREQCIAKGLKPFSKEFVQCGRDCGLIVGEDFGNRPDLMHFEKKF